MVAGIVLIQPAKSGGMGAAFGGIGASVFGGKAGSHLTKATVVMTALFFVLTLAPALRVVPLACANAAPTRTAVIVAITSFFIFQFLSLNQPF